MPWTERNLLGSTGEEVTQVIEQSDDLDQPAQIHYEAMGRSIRGLGEAQDAIRAHRQGHDEYTLDPAVHIATAWVEAFERGDFATVNELSDFDVNEVDGSKLAWLMNCDGLWRVSEAVGHTDPPTSEYVVTPAPLPEPDDDGKITAATLVVRMSETGHYLVSDLRLD